MSSKLAVAARNRWFSVALVVALLILAAFQVANPHSYLSEAISRIGETGSGPDAPITDLSEVTQLQATFNRDAGHARLILLLSPT